MKIKRSNKPLFLLIALIALASLIYLTKTNSKKIEALIIEDLGKNKFSAVGIASKSEILLCKDEEDKYLIPNSVFKNGELYNIIAVDENGKVYISESLKISENDIIKIKSKEDDKLLLENKTNGQRENINLPDISNWIVTKERGSISANFAADTDLEYTLYVIGKDYGIGISDKKSKGEKVFASWEAGKSMISLVKFKLK
ncbi:hypothetical protein [Anaerococcus sp. Marseille-P3625]|uniref:hypothetical protein n=1 Tax=Anaerococcus sp. Marseille-P3625 TaxID=1977277 RepID=UPI000C077432|nr:hypothetical protein [Anaerococcus sp. Marseille-P3625]